MKLIGSESWGRVILGVTFLGSALLKAEHAASAGVWARQAVPALREPGAIWTIIVLEVVIAIAMLTRFRRAAAYAAIVIAVSGAGLSALESMKGSPPACGCLGRIPLTHLQHVILSACIVLVAGQIVLGPAAQPSRGA